MFTKYKKGGLLLDNLLQTTTNQEDIDYPYNTDEVVELKKMIASATDQQKQQYIKKLFAWYLDHDAHIEALMGLTRNIKDVTDTSWLLQSLKQAMIPANTDYFKHYLTFYTHYHNTEQQFIDLFQNTLNSPYKNSFSTNSLHEIFLHLAQEYEIDDTILVKPLIEAYIKDEDWNTAKTLWEKHETDSEQRETYDQLFANWKKNFITDPETLLHQINEHISNKNYTEAKRLSDNTKLILNETSHYYSIIQSVSSYIENLISPPETVGAPGSAEAAEVQQTEELDKEKWEHSFTACMNEGLFTDAYFIIKTYRILVQDEAAFAQYDEIIQRGLKYTNLPKGNSNYAKAFRYHHIFEKNELAVAYFLKSLEEENVETVVKTMSPILRKLNKYEQLEELLVKYEDQIDAKKWYVTELCSVYKTQNKLAELLQFVKESFEASKKSTNFFQILGIYYKTIIDYYLIDEAFDAVRYLHNELLRQKHIAKKILLVNFYTDKKSKWMDEALQKLNEFYGEEEILELKETIVQTEKEKFSNTEEMLQLIKLYDEKRLYDSSLFLIEQVKSNNPLDYYLPILEIVESQVKANMQAEKDRKKQEEAAKLHDTIDQLEDKLYSLITAENNSELVKLSNDLKQAFPEDEKIQLYTKRIDTIIKGKYNSTERLFNIASRILTILGDNEKAIPYLEEALAAEGKKERTVKVLFTAYLKHKKYDTLLVILKKYSSHIINKNWLDNALIETYMRAEKYEEAITLLKVQLSKAVTDEDRIKLQSQIGDLFLRDQNVAEALLYADRILRQSEYHFNGLLLKVKCLIELGQLTNAKEWYKQVELRYPPSKTLENLEQMIDKKEQAVEEEKTRRFDEFTELLGAGDLRRVQQFIVQLKESLPADPETQHNSRNANFIFDNYREYLNNKQYKEGILFFLEMAAYNPNFPLIWTNIGKLYEELGQIKEANTTYYKSSLLSDRKKTWSIYVSFCMRRDLPVEKVLGLMHLYIVDQTDTLTQKELVINIKKIINKSSIQANNEDTIERILSFYSDHFESFHNSELKANQLIIGFIQLLKNHYKEALHLLDEHLDYYEKMCLAYYLVAKEEYELAKVQFEKLLIEDYQGFAKKGLELCSLLKDGTAFPKEFFHLIEYIPLTPSIDKIETYADFLIETENTKTGLESLQWLQKAFQDDLPLRRAVSKLQEANGNIEEAYHTMNQTISLGKHPNDFLHDIPDLIFFCFTYNMTYRIDKIIENTMNLKQEMIAESSTDNRIDKLKDDVLLLSNNLKTISEWVEQEDEELKASFAKLLVTLKERRFDSSLRFLKQEENQRLLENKLVLDVIYQFTHKEKMIIAILEDYFINSLYEEIQDELHHIKLLQSWRPDVFELIETTRLAFLNGEISEEDIDSIYSNIRTVKQYNELLLNSLKDYGSPFTSVVINVGQILFGDVMVSKAMSYFINNRGEDLDPDQKLPMLLFCSKIDPNDYYTMYIANILFAKHQWEEALSYYKQLSLDNKYRSQNLKMILLNEVLDRATNPTKYTDNPLDISGYQFFELNSLCSHLIKNSHTQSFIQPVKDYLQDNNYTFLYQLILFNEERLAKKWPEAFNILKNFASEKREIYTDALRYFMKKLTKHDGPEEVKTIVESEITRIEWSRTEVQPITDVKVDNTMAAEPENQEEEEKTEEFYMTEGLKNVVEEDYIKQFEDKEEASEQEQETMETSGTDEVEIVEEEEEEVDPTSINDFSKSIPQIWRDLTRYELDDHRERNTNLLQTLMSEASHAQNEEARAKAWLKTAKLAQELEEETTLLNALFQYGIHEMKNSLNLDMKFVRHYAVETLFIEKFRKQQIVSDDNLIKTIMSTLLDAVAQINKPEEILAEVNYYRWIQDNVKLGNPRFGLGAGIAKLNGLIRLIEKFHNSNEIDEKIEIYDSIVIRNKDLTKLDMKDKSWKKAFVSISKQWRKVIKTLNDSLYPRPNIQIHIMNDTIQQNGELFLELSNIGEGRAENVHVSLAEFEQGRELGSIEHTFDEIRPKKAKALSFALQFDEEREAELLFTVSYMDEQQKTKESTTQAIIKVQNVDKEFIDIPDRYQTTSVKRTKDFYGREDIIKKIRKNISGGDYDKVLVIHGLRRVGKTSILYYLNQTVNANLIPVLIDIQRVQNVTNTSEFVYNAFVEPIIEALEDQLDVEVPVPEESSFDSLPMIRLDKFLNKLKKHLDGKKILFMMDEFEGLIDAVNEGKIDKNIFESIRNMMQHREDSRFILVGADKVVEMLNDYASTIFSISVNIPVSFLEHSAAQQMIVEMAPEAKYTENAIKRLLELTNGHPYYTKILCSSVIQHLNNQKRNTVYLNDVDKATQEVVLDTHGEYFGFLWKMFDPVEKVVVSYIAEKLKDNEDRISLGKILNYFELNRDIDGGKLVVALENLVNRNILNENKQSVINNNDNEYHFSLDLYREWFKYNKPLIKTKIEVKDFVSL